MTSGDGILHYRDIIAIFQLVLFTPSLLAAYYFRRTHRLGWFCLGVFSLLRLIGAGCKLGTVTTDSHGLWAGVFVCESLGVLLLIFVLWEMMARINKTIPLLHKHIFTVPQLLTTIDIALSIAGFITVSHKSSNQLLPTPWSRASIALLALIFLYTCTISAYLYLHRRKLPHEELRLAQCAAACCPVLLVRVLYSVIFVATGDLVWNAVKGDPTAYLLMTMVPEVVVVGVCTFVIWGVRPLEAGGGKGGGQGSQDGEGEVNRV